MTYTEDTFVEQPAIKLFNSLDWQTLNCWDEVFGEESPLGRENRGDVILQNRLYPTLIKLNPKAPKLAIDEAILALRRMKKYICCSGKAINTSPRMRMRMT